MNEFKAGDKLVHILENIHNCTGKLYTFERYYDLIKANPQEYLWVKELASPVQSSHFRLATSLEIELQSE